MSEIPVNNPPGEGAKKKKKRKKKKPTSDAPESASQNPSNVGGNNNTPIGDKAQPQIPQKYIILPQRPTKVAEKGKAIGLSVNHFKVEIPKQGIIFHYDCDIGVKIASRKFKREFHKVLNKELLKLYPNVGCTFDGARNIYTNKLLPIEDDLTKIKFSELATYKNDIYATIKLASRLDLQKLHSAFVKSSNVSTSNIYSYLTAYDIILNHLPSMQYVSFGRSFFDEKVVHKTLADGCDLWEGFFQSIRPSQSGLTVNVDVAYSCFYKKQSVLYFLRDNGVVLDTSAPISPGVKYRIYSLLKGVRISVNHTGRVRVFVVSDINEEPISHVRFEDLKLVDYYKNTYKITFKNQFQPTLVCGIKKNLFPIELCEIDTPQRFSKNLSTKMLSSMIRSTCTDPLDRMAKIKNIARNCNFPNDAVLKKFQIKINPNMIVLKGRVINPPKLLFGDNKSVLNQPYRSSWDWRSKSFYKPATFSGWGVLVASERFSETELTKFIKEVQYTGRSLKLGFPKQFIKMFTDRRNSDLEKMIRKMSEELQKPGLIFVILDDKNDVYHRVKKCADVQVGIMTQCILNTNAYQSKAQLISNLLLKVNSKMGGLNQIVESTSFPLSTKGIIFFGADVTHPVPFGDEKAQSIAAVVASMDNYPANYFAIASAQTRRCEIILDLKRIVKAQMTEYYKRNNQKKPQHIFFYRDGVGEGQFQQVLTEELRAIKQACASLENNYKPLITFIVVQKRHHTRMFANDPRDRLEKNKNVPPGTIIDTDIVHPKEYDFFMVSSEGIKGTSRPTHYHVLYDDTNISADNLQRMTYNLCYTYVRATRSVSVPSPVYYAHLVAFRARHHVKDCRREEKWEDLVNVNRNLLKTMYFV